MKRKLTGFLAIVVAAVLFCSCQNGGAQSGTAQAVSSQPNAPKVTIDKWAVPPSIEAEDIKPLVTSYDRDYCVNYYKPHLLEAIAGSYYHDVSVVVQNGQEGLIDYTGTLRLPAAYSRVWLVEDKIVAADGEGGEGTVYHGVNEHYALAENTAEMSKYASQWVWDVGKGRPYHMFGREPVLYDRYPETVVPVQMVRLNHDLFLPPQEAADGVAVHVYNPEAEGDLYLSTDGSADPYRGRWGYAIGEELVIPDQYERCQYMCEGIGAASRGGKWYYVTEAGEEINQSGYDTAWNNPFTAWAKANAFDFSEGLCAVTRDGKWGYINRSGEEVIPCQFEATRPVYNGRAWVKKDGLWGVADLSALTTGA